MALGGVMSKPVVSLNWDVMWRPLSDCLFCLSYAINSVIRRIIVEMSRNSYSVGAWCTVMYKSSNFELI